MATFITLLEIYSNPKDLLFQIFEKDNAFAVLVSRGPGHNFKVMLSSEYVYKTAMEAALVINEVLETVLKECSGNFICTKFKSFALTRDDVQKIVHELGEKGISKTYS